MIADTTYLHSMTIPILRKYIVPPTSSFGRIQGVLRELFVRSITFPLAASSVEEFNISGKAQATEPMDQRPDLNIIR